MTGADMSVKLVIFDMDGTVFESFLDWTRIKKELNLKNRNILRSVYRDSQVDHQKLALLEKYEKENTQKTRPIRGIAEFLSFLRQKQVKVALVTNNNKSNTEYLLNKFRLEFHESVTRESGLWKPDPDAFLYLMNRFSSTAAETISIGDSSYDIEASKRADIPYIFIINNPNKPIKPSIGTVVFQDYFELKGIIELRHFAND